MLVLTDETIAQFGIVTRETKGSELTHAEMDKNMVIALDVVLFYGNSYDDVKEYTSLMSAGVAVEGSNTIISVNGYCSLKMPAELAGMEIALDGRESWMYEPDFSDYNDSENTLTVTLDGTFSTRSDIDITIVISAGSGY